MGNTVSKFCTECFQSEEDNSIPLISTTSKSLAASDHSTKSEDTFELKIEENHPKQEYFFKVIEKASIEFLSHIRCPFEEEGFTEIVKKENLRVHSKETENGYMMKSEYYLNCKPNEFIELMLDIEHRKLWDDNIEVIELLFSLPEDTTVTYLKYKKVLLISSRDAILVNRVMRAHNGIVFVSASCELESHPPNDFAVRANIEVSGYYIEPFENKSKVIGFTLGDVGGSIPKAFVKTATATALPKFIASVEKIIKNKKW